MKENTLDHQVLRKGDYFKAMKKILLYSGGMDSWLIDKIWKPDEKIYINMHTRYSEQEINKLKARGEDVKILDFPLGQYEREDKIIPLRNLYLVMAICNYTGNEDVDICLGATAGDRVLDKSKGFVERANELLNYLYQPQWWIPEGKKVNVNINFKDKTKEDLLQMYLDNGGTLEEAFKGSFSCYEPDEENHECWSCKPCFRKFVAFASKGYEFPEEVLEKVIPYISKEIIPDIKAGTYGRGEAEEKAILEIFDKYKEYDK